MNHIEFGNSTAAVCREPNLVRHMFCPGEEGKGSQNRWLTRTRESPPARTQAHGHVGPATPSASRSRPVYLSPAPGSPHACTHSAAQSAHSRQPQTLSLSPSRHAPPPPARREPRERERSGWPPRWSTTLGWTPSRSGSCSRTSEHPFFSPSPSSRYTSRSSPSVTCLSVSLCVRVSAICLSPACSGTRIDICSISLGPGVGFSFAVAQLPAPPDLAAIGTRARFGSRRLFSTTEFVPVIILFHVLVSPSHVFDAL